MVTMVAAELSIESIEDRMAPINPAATMPTKPNPTGATTSRMSMGKAVS